ncbi:hypothetical protein ACP70R_043323 [Stipagrostis hirtigluma subsp. patula]
MLLRSASSPLPSRARAPAGAGHLAVVSPWTAVASPRQGTALCRATSEGGIMAEQLARAARSKRNDNGHGGAPSPWMFVSPSASIIVDEEEEEEGEEDVVAEVAVPLRRLLTSTGLGVDVVAAPEAADVTTLVEEGVGGGGGGRKARGGGGQDGDGGGDSRAAADAHYRRMIEADPGNSLLLGNYARFLAQVVGHAARAQEFYERAILADPGDAEALALYAGLVWETSGDARRADAYYGRAVQAAPNDCYVLASYAGFLWDAEEDDEDELPPPAPFLGAAQPLPITAAS